MKEIGGYFEFEKLKSNELYEKLLKFNSARNCLRYIIKKRKIGKIFLPFFLCEVISDVCKKENVLIEYYHITEDFLPCVDKNELKSDSYLYIINHYGMLNNSKLTEMKEIYKNIIIDNTHAFFQEPIDGIDTIYNCRKYFGVPDGAYLATNLDEDITIKYGKSGFRIKHLVGRFEEDASSYYEDFKQADESFIDEEIMYMSKFTENLMGAIDYEMVLKTRRENFQYMDKQIGKYNKLDFKNNDMTFMYPLLIEDAENLRKILIENKIYIPILWQNVITDNDENMMEYKLVKNIIPIPIDQRYDLGDMKRICAIVNSYIERKKYGI